MTRILAGTCHERRLAGIVGAVRAFLLATAGETPLVATSRFGYLRLRRPACRRDALARWVDRIRAQP